MNPLQDAVAEELAPATPTQVAAFAAALAERAQGGCAGVLFYGSTLRTGDLSGLLDFYVLLDRDEAWPQSAAARAAMRRLPPNVEYHEREGLRAKAAVMSLEAFQRAVRPESLDTTVWARFCQPAGLAWVRDEAARAHIEAAVAQAVATASRFAAALWPEQGPASSFWGALFAQTYSAELRVEDAARPRAVLADAARYARLLPLGWAAAGLAFDQDGEALSPRLDPGARRGIIQAWERRRRLAKPLNMARLAKAAFTFQGAADYVAWKVERHSGHRLPITPWRRRHPLLSAPWALWRLWRAGVVK